MPMSSDPYFFFGKRKKFLKFLNLILKINIAINFIQNYSFNIAWGGVIGPPPRNRHVNPHISL